jgi:hypothetical protein
MTKPSLISRPVSFKPTVRTVIAALAHNFGR